MKGFPLIAVSGMAFAFPSQVSAEDLSSQETRVEMHSNRGGNSATIIQSGDPAKAKVRVIQKPGYTSVEQHSQGNSATIIQSDGEQ